MAQEIGKIEDTSWGPMRVIRQKDFDEARKTGITKFSNCYFDGVTFKGQGDRLDFSGSKFGSDCKFKDCKFTHCDFTNTSIYCDVEMCDLSGSNFTRATISSSFSNTDLSNSFFKDSSLRDMTFTLCKLNRCEMYQAKLNAVDFVVCEAFFMEHVDTLSLTVAGATSDEVKNYQRKVKEALIPKVYDEPFSQIQGMQLGSQLHIYDSEWEGPPLAIRHIPQGLTLEAATRQWLNSPNGLPYKMRALHNYERMFGIAEKDCLTEIDFLTAHWQLRPGVDPKRAEQKLQEYAKKWRAHQQTPQRPTVKKTAIEIAKEQITTLCANFKRNPADYIEYLSFAARFYEYSGRNKMLIFHQNGAAQFVGSRTSFAKQGYDLKPGEWRKPLWIIRPESKDLFMRKDGLVVAVKDATPAEKKKIEAGEIQPEKVTFYRPARVYEIGQTTCPPADYPKLLGHGISEAQHAHLYERLKNLVQLSGIPVVEKPLPVSLFGYCDTTGRSITISDSLGDTQKLATLNHEYAHALLHSTRDLPPAIEEFEAESTALIMQQRLGLPVEDLTVSYVKDCLRQAQELPEIDFEQSIGRIVKQADFVCEKLSLQEMARKPEIQYAPVQGMSPNFSPTL